MACVRVARQRWVGVRLEVDSYVTRVDGRLDKPKKVETLRTDIDCTFKGRLTSRINAGCLSAGKTW